MRRVRRRSALAHRPVDAGPHRLGPRVPFLSPVGQPEHVARAAGVHDAAGRSRRAEIARGSVERTVLGQRRLVAHQGVRDGPRPDLPQPPRARGPRHRRAGRRGARARRRHRRAAAGARRSEDRRAGGRRGLQGRRGLHGAVPRTPRRSSRSGSPTATASRGRRPSAARRRGSSSRTCGGGAATTARRTTGRRRACSSRACRSRPLDPISWTSRRPC